MNKIPIIAICLAVYLTGLASANDSMDVRCVGRFGTSPNRARDVAVVGGYAYLLDDSLFHVVSVADPMQPPTEVGRLRVLGSRLAVQDSYVYVLSDSNRLRVISVADPANPVEVGHCDVHRAPQGIAVSGDYVYVAAWDSGLRIISIADPTNPVEVAHVDTFGNTNSVAVSGDYAYVGAEWLRVVLISDPTHPVAVGRCVITYDPAAHIVVSGYYAYAEGWSSENLVVIRVADPAHPVQVWQLGGDYGGVAVEGSRRDRALQNNRDYFWGSRGSRSRRLGLCGMRLGGITDTSVLRGGGRRGDDER